MIYTKLGQVADKAGVYSVQPLSILLCNFLKSKACCRLALQNLNAFPATEGADMKSVEGKLTTPQYQDHYCFASPDVSAEMWFIML